MAELVFGHPVKWTVAFSVSALLIERRHGREIVTEIQVGAIGRYGAARVHDGPLHHRCHTRQAR